MTIKQISPFTTLLAVYLFLACCARAADSQPAKPDFSSPKSVARSAYTLVFAGQFEDAKKCFAAPANDEEKTLLQDGWSDDIFAFPVFRMLKEKFPDQVGKAFPDIASRGDTLLKNIDSMQEKIEGAKASLTGSGSSSGPASEPIQCVKVGNDWKLAIVPGAFLHKVPEQFVAQTKAMKEMFVTFMDDLKAGKLKSPEEAMKALNDRRAEVVKKFTPSQPTPAPQSAPPAPR